MDEDVEPPPTAPATPVVPPEGAFFLTPPPPKLTRAEAQVENIKTLHAFWQETTGLSWTLSPTHQKAWKAVLEATTMDRAKAAVRGLMLSKFHTGGNAEGKRILDPKSVLKNLDAFADASVAPVIPDASAITAQMEALVEERFAHREHFVETFHAQHKMEDATAVLPEWEVDLRAAWGNHFPRRHIMHLGQMVLVTDTDSLHFHCVMLAALAYTRQLTDEKYRDDGETSVCVRREAANAERNQRRALKEQIARTGSAS